MIGHFSFAYLHTKERRKSTDKPTFAFLLLLTGARLAAVASTIVTLGAASLCRSYLAFISTSPSTTWFRLTIIILGIHVLSRLVTLESNISVLARAVTGAIILLHLPGFVTFRYLFNGQTSHAVHQLAFSIGVSVIIILLLALILNFTPLGLSPTPLSIITSFYIIAASILTTRKQFKIFRSHDF